MRMDEILSKSCSSEIIKDTWIRFDTFGGDSQNFSFSKKHNQFEQFLKDNYIEIYSNEDQVIQLGSWNFIMQLIVSFPVLFLCMGTLNNSRVLYFIIKLFNTKKTFNISLLCFGTYCSLINKLITIKLIFLLMGILAVAQVQIVYFWTFPEYLPLIVGYLFQTNTRFGSRISRRWGRQSWGAPTYDFAKFCEKLHEIGKILGLNPPLNTTSDLTAIWFWISKLIWHPKVVLRLVVGGGGGWASA